MDQQFLQEIHQKIAKVIDVLKQDLGTIRTGRANPGLVENIIVNAYGGTTKLRVMELATVGVTDAQTIVITPFDASIIGDIQKGIMDSGAGLNPASDGHVLRVTIPPLSQERREELSKLMKHKLENGRIMVRQVRHEAMDEIKKAHNDKLISDDDQSREEKEVQRVIDETMKTIDEMGNQKEAELMQV
jgi:ribosome recycling factor